MEFHPRLDRNNLEIKENKIILGSFPTWSLAANCENYLNIRGLTLKGELPFFFGSSRNQFWSWYQKFIDPKVEIINLDSLVTSLKINRIGVTDLILNCERKGRSALDKHLSNRTYNYKFFCYPSKGLKLKILCTSKGVMNDMLLTKTFFKTHEKLSINRAESHSFQEDFLKRIKGSTKSGAKAIFTELQVEEGGIIECLSIPSPGSPYRRLIDFGHNAGNSEAYLNTYLSAAFSWFIS